MRIPGGLSITTSCWLGFLVGQRVDRRTVARDGSGAMAHGVSTAAADDVLSPRFSAALTRGCGARFTTGVRR